MVTLYGIKACDTVKKARRWLDQNLIAYQFHDVRVDGLTSEQLQGFAERVDWNTLLNRSSTSWRQLSDEQRAHINLETALSLMLITPTLIKRPLLDTGNKLIVGFKEASYSAELL